MKAGRREASVMRYKEKRQNRLFSKTIRYQVRKLNAEKRPRIKVPNYSLTIFPYHELDVDHVSNNFLTFLQGRFVKRDWSVCVLQWKAVCVYCSWHISLIYTVKRREACPKELLSINEIKFYSKFYNITHVNGKMHKTSFCSNEVCNTV